MIMRMKTSVILVEKYHFLHKIQSSALPLGEVVFGGNENLQKKKHFCD